MRNTRTQLLPVSTALACLLLVAGVASADRDKDESGKGRDRYDREYEYDDRWDDDDWDRGSRYAPNSGWSVGGSWEGSRGGVDVQVYGGTHRYPRHRYYERDYRHYSSRRIPPGHLPPPGECRVWSYDRPAGHQPPPTSCWQAERYAHRHGGRVIYGGPRR